MTVLLPARAAQGRPGAGPGWQACSPPLPGRPGAPLKPATTPQHRTVEVPPRARHPPLFCLSSAFFPLSAIFGCCPPDQSSSWYWILRCQPDILSILDPLPRELWRERRCLITCHCPCFCPVKEDTRAPDRPWIVGLVPELKWLLLDNALPTPPCTFTGDRLGAFSVMSSLVHMIASLDLQSRDVVTSCDLTAPRPKSGIKMTCQSYYARLFLFHSSLPAQVSFLGAESQVNWMLPHCISQRILSLTRVTGYVSM